MTSSPDAPHKLPPGLDDLRYMGEKEITALIGFAVQILQNWRYLDMGQFMSKGGAVRYRLKISLSG